MKPPGKIHAVLLIILMIQCGVEDGLAVQRQDSASLETVPPEMVTGDDAEERPVIDYFKWVFSRLEQVPLVLVILYAVSIFSIISMLVMLVFILLNRNRMEKEAKLRTYLLEEYQRLLMDYLFEEGEGEKAFRTLKRVAKSSLNRQVLIDQIIDIMVNLKGEVKQKARNLYMQLGLKSDSMAKSRSRKWHKKIKGYRELAFMDIRDANHLMTRSLDSKNEILRMEAQIALVRLSDENPFEWLHNLQKPLSKWDQITLVELLAQHEMPVPEFKQWFYSENLTVVIFALEMIARFEQKGAEAETIEMFGHPDANVRRTAIRVCGDVQFRQALEPMKEGYWNEPYDNKLEILRSFAKVPDPDYLDFLKSVLDGEEDVQLQILATKAMENTDEPGISMLIKLMKSKSEYKNYQIIIRHVLDGRIY